MQHADRFLFVFFGIGTAFQTHACILSSRCGCCVERNERYGLLGQFQFGSECQQLRFTGDLASEVMTNS